MVGLGRRTGSMEDAGGLDRPAPGAGRGAGGGGGGALTS